MSGPILDPRYALPFAEAALPVLRNAQLRKNVAHAIDTIQAKRARLVAEKADWQALRDAASAIRSHVLEHLPGYLEEFETRCTAQGGIVHWAADAAEARDIALKILAEAKADSVVKVKSMTTAEIQLNAALEQRSIAVFETDLAEIILQLGDEEPSHIVVPALHVNRAQIREIFAREMNLPNLSDEPQALAEAARVFLRRKFLTSPAAISGANFLIAESGAVAVVESEGNGRMCLTLPQTLITIAGIEKVLPRFRDLEVFLQLLARSATGERMNPYTSLWTGVTPGDGPQNFHIILLDNRRSSILARPVERQTLKCIRCAACMNTCPVYRQTGGHAYGSVYPGPIGAILTPQLMGMQHAQSLPFASTLCGACYEVCPVKINIPEVLVELRAEVVAQGHQSIGGLFERLAMQVTSFVFRDERRFQVAQTFLRFLARLLTRKDGWIHALPAMGGKWTQTRDLPGLPPQSFRMWWRDNEAREPAKDA
ncbi:MAG: LutB/LldF family L-lactate oxidation iron-sulfur protein [Rhizomicrobium sp.]|nr:LutB/LldF family L-lactate oxidation iron-sulfur protein [Rhizomicrobium sp.]